MIQSTAPAETKPQEKPWWTLDASEVEKRLATMVGKGLSPREAESRLNRYGPNTLAARQRLSPWAVLISQFQDFMVMVLLGATAISLAMGEWQDGAVILLIVVLNAGLGFFQEYRAERSLEALRKLASPLTRVLRGGEVLRVPAAGVVPGDVVLLEAGDRIPADLRLVETWSLEVEEANLTGESLPVCKTSRVLEQAYLPLADRHNMAYMSTMVTRGRGTGVVVCTGQETELGKIAGMISQGKEENTPLQRRLDQLGRWLVMGCLGICALVFLVGVWHGEPLGTMFLTGVSLAVAAIPEGLPAIVTIALALGVQRMSRRRAVIRRLPAVETLGNVTVICADKTGTLTENRMMAEKLWVDGRSLALGRGFSPQILSSREGQAFSWLLRIAGLCHGVVWNEKTGQGEGDPTETGLLAMTQRFGLSYGDLTRQFRRMGEIPFEAERRMMSVICMEEKGEFWVMTKGAPDAVLQRCDYQQEGAGVVPLSPIRRQSITSAVEAMAGEGLRVLAMAYRPGKEMEASAGGTDAERVERNLIFVGLVGLQDPPRPEVSGAIQQARGAGIRTMMITGDHARTAKAIATQLGLPARRVMTGVQLDAVPDQELGRVVAECSVYARVSPEHKLRLVRALKRRGEVVVMTGDGVNDAPAIREADVGIAMGKNGTDVAREAAAMVLADDNYATIVAAVEEGRGIYDNIRRFIRYLLACNVGEILTMACAVLARFPVPLLPIQILWMNLVTDGLPAIALGVNPPEADLMDRPPRRAGEGIFTRREWGGIMAQGAVMALVTIGIFLWGLVSRCDGDTARTMAFTTLVLIQLIYATQCGVGRRGWLVNLGSRPVLTMSVGFSILLQLVVLYLPGIQWAFHTVPLNRMQWLAVGVAVLYATFMYDFAAKAWHRVQKAKKEFPRMG